MKKLGLVLIILTFIACSKSKTPKYVIPHNKMVDIITDIHRADGLFTTNNIRKEIIKKDSLNIYNEILESYGYTRHDFDTSLYYYSENLGEYDKIYTEVLNRLNEMDTKLKAEENKERAKDSL